MQDVIHDPVRDWCACEPEGDVRCGYRILADAVIAKLAPRDGDEAEVALLITAVYQAADRVAGLEALARDMLSRFVRTSDGHRARAGQVQIARWEKQLGGGNGVSRTPGARCRGGPSPRRRAAAGSPPWPGPATGARSGRTSTGAPTSGRRRALNAALEAEEIMPDISPGPEWYRELREDDQLAELAAERDRYQAAMAVAREPEPAPRPDPAPRTPPHHGGQPLRAVRLPDDRCRAPGDVR